MAYDPWTMIDYWKETYRAEFILCEESKKPCFEGWQTESRSVKDLQKHIEGGGAVGMKIPAGVICLDMDKPSGKAWVETHKTELPFYQATRNGYHVFFKAPSVRPSGKRTKTGIEVTYRFAGANQINVAPSPGKEWVVNRLEALPELPEELNTGKTSKFTKEIKGLDPKDKPKDTSSVQYLSLYGLHIPIYLEDRPRMPMDQSICCRKMTWRLAHTPKGERNQTRLECGNLAGSYLMGKSLSFQELRWVAWTAQKHSEQPRKALQEFFQAVNNALAQGVARTYGIDKRGLSRALLAMFQGQDFDGVFVTNETLRALGVVPSRSLGRTIQKKINGQNVRVRMITDLVANELFTEEKGDEMKPKRATEDELLTREGEKCAI